MTLIWDDNNFEQTVSISTARTTITHTYQQQYRQQNLRRQLETTNNNSSSITMTPKITPAPTIHDDHNTQELSQIFFVGTAFNMYQYWMFVIV